MKKNNIDRREFLKTAGSTAMVMSGLGLVAGCKNAGSNASAGSAVNNGNGEMTLRTNRVSGDKVSILGYGCMRWPMIKDENGRDIALSIVSMLWIYVNISLPAISL